MDSFKLQKIDNLRAFVFSEHKDFRIDENTAREIVRILDELAEPANEAKQTTKTALNTSVVGVSTTPCTHPADQLEDWHDSAVLCLACSCIISQFGESINPPTPLCG